MPRKRGRKSRSTWGSNDDAGAGRRRLRYWADLHDGKGYARHSKTIVGTKTDGDEELARLRVQHSQDRPVPTLGQAFAMWWLPDATDRLERGEMARSTYDNYLSRWRKHVAPRWEDVAVTDVRPLDVQEWLLTKTSTMGSMSLMLMRQVLDLCQRYEVVGANVAAQRYRIPKKVEREHSKDVYNLREMVAALDAVRGTVAYLPAVLCGLASCRVGEALGPRVDLGEVRPMEVGGMVVAVVDVIRNVDQNGHPGEDHVLKNRQSERPVIVPAPWSADVLAAAGPWLTDRGDGRPTPQTTANDVWSKTLSDAGIKPIPMRNLRNSWRTFMRWELGIDEDKLEAMMGHAGKNVGEVHYDRPREEVFAQTVADAWMRYRAS